ncbi:hypothetical protein CEP88_08510 [Roseobacter denitrificans]|nr:hypothetical protein CEP88_08510 [Roseobacter denitrificans]
MVGGVMPRHVTWLVPSAARAMALGGSTPSAGPERLTDHIFGHHGAGGIATLMVHARSAPSRRWM